MEKIHVHKNMHIIRDEMFDRAKLLYKSGKYYECAQLCRNILNFDDVADRRNVYHLLADALLDLHEYEKAVDAYNNILDLGPDEIAYANRGYAYMAEKKWTFAVDDYTRALKINPQNVSSLDFAAACFIELNRPADAVDLISKAILRKISDDRLYKRLGIAFSMQNRWGKAYRAFRAALKLNPKDQYSRDSVKTIEEMVSDANELDL